MLDFPRLLEHLTVATTTKTNYKNDNHLIVMVAGSKTGSNTVQLTLIVYSTHRCDGTYNNTGTSAKISISLYTGTSIHLHLNLLSNSFQEST